MNTNTNTSTSTDQLGWSALKGQKDIILKCVTLGSFLSASLADLATAVASKRGELKLAPLTATLAGAALERAMTGNDVKVSELEAIASSATGAVGTRLGACAKILRAIAPASSPKLSLGEAQQFCLERQSEFLGVMTPVPTPKPQTRSCKQLLADALARESALVAENTRLKGELARLKA